MISMIACVTSDMYIGYRNDLLFKLKPDMDYFKQKTLGHTVVMGKNTYMSLPGMKPLSNRTNVVISSTLDIAYSGFTLYPSVHDFLLKYESNNDEIFVIGGAKIYKAFMPFANRIYLTHVHRTLPDLFFGKEVDQSRLVRFPDSLYDYNWDILRSADESCFDKDLGLVRYNFLMLTRK